MAMSGGEFGQGWAVLVRDTGWSEEDDVEKDVVSELTIYWDKADALAEVRRLRADDPSVDHFYYCQETQVERRL
jgi:hypothetical protein